MRKSLVLWLVVCACTGGAWASKETRIDNSAEAPVSTVVQTRELWRIGGDSEDPTELFGLITDLAVDSKERIYTIDRQLCEVKVFNSAGEFVLTAGREGEGPGEFRGPARIFTLREDEFCVMQAMPARLSVFEQNGAFRETIALKPVEEGGFQYLNEADARGGTFVIQGMTSHVREGHMEQVSRIVGIDMNGIEITEYGSSSRRFDFAKMVVHENETNPLRWVIGPSGRMYVVKGFDYEIEVKSAKGVSQMIITRDYKHRERSEDEKESVLRYYRRGGGTEGVDIEVMSHHQDIQWMQVADDGRLWILSSRGAKDRPENTLGVFDIYEQGRFVEQTTVKGNADPERDRYYLFGDRIYVVTQYSDAVRAWQARTAVSTTTDEEPDPEPMSIVCYQLIASP
jgi:hypothetical protein